jgi:Saf4/Yju2 protein
MGERKVINKYLPPDFDPKLIPRSKKAKDGLVSVRMMLPFSIQCNNCSTFMYQGRKFNSKKEVMTGENGKYLSIQRFRFYIKCTACSQPISFLTDPKNADYEMESGATRNYELQKDKKESEDTAALEQETEEKEDPLKGLENRVLVSQREMQEMDTLEEIKAMNLRHVKLLNSSGSAFDANSVLNAREQNKHQMQDPKVIDSDDLRLTEEDEALVRSIQFGSKAGIKRLSEHDELILEEKRSQQASLFEKQQAVGVEASLAKSVKPSIYPVIAAKRRRVQDSKDVMTEKSSEGLGNLLEMYDSDSD